MIAYKYNCQSCNLVNLKEGETLPAREVYCSRHYQDTHNEVGSYETSHKDFVRNKNFFERSPNGNGWEFAVLISPLGLHQKCYSSKGCKRKRMIQKTAPLPKQIPEIFSLFILWVEYKAEGACGRAGVRATCGMPWDRQTYSHGTWSCCGQGLTDSWCMVGARWLVSQHPAFRCNRQALVRCWGGMGGEK